VIRSTTFVESIIIRRDKAAFWGGIAKFLRIMIPVAIINNR
jgi:hypothetical protein